MDTETRSETELYALMLALQRSKGAAPSWLSRELTVPPDPFTTVSPATRRSQRALAASFASLLAAVWFGAAYSASAAPAPKLAYAAPAIDWEGLDAVALVQESRLAGDDETVLSRLGGIRRHAEGPAWRAEKTAENVYLVVYREPAGLPAYAFEVDLETEVVTPTPEAVDSLTARRVRDAAETLQMVASAPAEASPN